MNPLIIPPKPAPVPYSMPALSDANQTAGQLRARYSIRMEIAEQDRERNDMLSYTRNIAEAMRLESLIAERMK